MNTNVKIDGVVFKGCATTSINLSSEVTDKNADSGEVVNDHVSKSPVSFSLEITFYSSVFEKADKMGENHEASGTAINSGLFNRMDQYLFIADLWQNKLLFDFECDLGYFGDMVITSLQIDETNESGSSFKASLAIKQFKKVEFQPAVFQYITDANGKVVGVAPMGNYDSVTLKKPPNEKHEPDIYDNISDWYNRHLRDPSRGIVDGIKDFFD